MVKTLASENHNVVLICQALKVSRSGYYAWRKRPPSSRSLQDEKLARKIRDAHEMSRGTYGSPRVTSEIRDQGESCGKHRVARIMRAQGLVGVTRRKFRVQTTDSKHAEPIGRRVLQTEVPATHPSRPNQIWVSDITYVPTAEGWLYLAVYLDVFTRKIVGYGMADHLRTDLVLRALRMGLARQCQSPEVAHSDRGIQYACCDYRSELARRLITISHSRKGNCYDNAFAESFFHTLKVELVHRRKFMTRKEAESAIFEYIEVWYNRKRRHSSLGYRSPIKYEEAALAA